MRQLLRKHRSAASERGATAIEYGLIAGSIAVAITGAVFLLGVNVAELFGGVSGRVADASGATSPPLIMPLVNGGFASDVPAGRWTMGSLDGWTNSGSRGLIEQWGDGFLGMGASEGASFIELDAGSAGTDHVQTTVDMVAGASYTLRFDHAARPGSGAKDDVEITHNGTAIATVSPRTIDKFETAEVTLTGVEGEDVIGFREVAGQNNSVGVLLDNVRIE